MSVDDVWNMFLCESRAVYLRPDRLYRFKVDRNCPKCVRLAKKAADAETLIERVGRSLTASAPTKAGSER
jgi:hypothetical protein